MEVTDQQLNGTEATPSTRRPMDAILEDLAKPIPDRHISIKSKGGRDILFVAWHRMQQIFDYYTAGHWEHSVAVEIRDGYAYATCHLTVHGADASLTRSATGCESLRDHDDGKAYGDPTSNAEAQAFKRACARFGLALNLLYG